MSKSIVYDVPLRPTFMGQLVVPRDMTKAEAARLCIRAVAGRHQSLRSNKER